MVGEIRTPETTSQVLRAAISGHMVISTIHANSVEDALNSMIKYATAAGLNEELAADLLSRGILGVVHQKLQGTKVLFPEVRYVFANPDTTQGDQLRVLVRDRILNLGTLIESQMAKMFQGKPLFRDPGPLPADL
ncbi:MAG: putative type II secretion system protein E [Alphaproteobacteria bacterium ADurb.Bin438]|nr:MAG: putative type II secretion system protein E [Alphaproteobacteria bacterium ADurb.Bin438]